MSTKLHLCLRSRFTLLVTAVSAVQFNQREKHIFEVCKYAICRQMDLYHTFRVSWNSANFRIMAPCQRINSLIFSTKRQKFQPHEIFTSSRLESLESGHIRNWKRFISQLIHYTFSSRIFSAIHFVSRLWTEAGWIL